MKAKYIGLKELENGLTLQYGPEFMDNLYFNYSCYTNPLRGMIWELSHQTSGIAKVNTAFKAGRVEPTMGTVLTYLGDIFDSDIVFIDLNR